MVSKISFLFLFLIPSIICDDNQSNEDGLVAKHDDQKRNLKTGFDFTEEEMVKFKLWPNGVIPYYIDVISFDKVLRDRIRSYLDNINSETGLRFAEWHRPPESSENKRYVFFINRRGVLDCNDYTTKSFSNEGVQKIVLGYNCLTTGAEMSKIVLALAGVPPQHNAPNRDKYITVQLDNVIPENKALFEKFNDDEWLFHDVPYDFKSVGHYHWHQYSSNGKATIKPKEAINIPVGETQGFSNSDVKKLSMLYNHIQSKFSEHKLSKCTELYEPGVNFNTYVPDKTKSEPIKKPNQYLGLSDQEEKNKEKGTDKNEASNENAPGNDNNKQNNDKEQKENNNSDGNQGIMDNDNKGVNNMNIRNSKKTKLAKTKLKLSNPVPDRPEHPFDESDWNSDEQNRQLIGYNNK